MTPSNSLQVSSGDLRNLVENYLEAVLVVDGSGMVRYANRKATALFGDGLAPGKPCPVPLRTGTLTLTGDPPLTVSVRLSRIEWNDQPCQFALLRELSEDAWNNEETERLAFEDDLTGLPNLNIIRQFMDFTLTQAQRYDRAAALLVIDLDRFKVVNDAMGMAAGNDLLCQVATRLQSIVRSSDIVGRRGEDEFMLLLTELTADRAKPGEPVGTVSDRAATVASRLLDELKQPFTVGGGEYHIGASIGISLCPQDATNNQEMLEHAESAMYLAKERGRGRYQFYTPEMQSRHDERLVIENGLHAALKKGDFVLHYQPVVELESGEIVGVEALLRWCREGKLVAAQEFIQIAEDSGLIVPIGDWVIREACAQTRQWHSQGLELFTAINLSARQLLRPDLTRSLLKSIEVAGLEPRMIQFDVKEDVGKIDPDQLETLLRGLREQGVRIAVDDFGVGLSSLRQLRALGPDLLKVDRSLVAGLPEEAESVRLVEAYVRLADSLGLTSLAEGIETRGQCQVLRDCKCRFGQGYLFAEPLPAEQIDGLLSKGHRYET